MRTWNKLMASGVLALVLSSPSWAKPDGTAFKTPEQAVQALSRVAQSRDPKALRVLFGWGWEKLVPAGKAERDATLKGLARLIKERWSLAPTQQRDKVLRLGAEGWSFPVPLDKTAKGWQFDTEKGLRELENRRIGRNELLAIETCQLLSQAQALYHAEDRDGDGKAAYATEIFSGEGKKDGLYWQDAGKSPSPLAQLFQDSSAFARTRAKGDPWFGYYFGLAQVGEGGYTIVAWPAEYDKTGVMSFWFDQSGKLYEKNLGPNSGTLLRDLTSTSKGEGWEIVGNAL